jgi:hypothetical protein
VRRTDARLRVPGLRLDTAVVRGARRADLRREPGLSGSARRARGGPRNG